MLDALVYGAWISESTSTGVCGDSEWSTVQMGPQREGGQVSGR